MKKPEAIISVGRRINQHADKLQLVSLSDVHARIVKPAESALEVITQLRSLPADADKRWRSQLKLRLPYFVCASFEDSIRRISNFKASNCLVLDFDGFCSEPYEMAMICRRLVADSRVALLFVSPSGSGIKAVFRLATTCEDPAAYSKFHKAFSVSFAQAHQLAGYLDTCTSDVTRACFLSYDPSAYLNPDPTLLEFSAAEPAPLRMAPVRPISERNDSPAPTSSSADVESPQSLEIEAEMEITDEEIDEFLESVMADKKPSESSKPPVYVPIPLLQVKPEICADLIQTGIVIDEMMHISYGIKFRISYASGKVQGEIDVFHGRKGFTVHENGRTGTDARLNAAAAARIRNLLRNAILEDRIPQHLRPQSYNDAAVSYVAYEEVTYESHKMTSTENPFS
jgi:hypothetical protein